MLTYSVTVSVDGFIADRDGDIGWTSAPSDEVFACHLEGVRGLGAYILGRRLYEMMRIWETEPSMRRNADTSEFADVWQALPKVVFSRTLGSVEGNARLATAPLAEEIAAALAATDKDVSIGGAELAGAAMELGLLDELRIFRAPAVLGGGKRHLPAVTETIPLNLVETRTFDSGVIFERYQR